MGYIPNEKRYNSITYNRCGNSGIKLPAISLGLWNNFGAEDVFENQRKMVRRAFDLGITHFDLANNYGPPPGSAEENLGRILKKDFAFYRDEMIISTKAGFDMWDGPYGNWGSKKHLVSSLDQSLKRMNLDYVDIFYHHRPDPETPLEETMGALDHLVRQGKALYVGLSNYREKDTKKAIDILKQQGTPFIIHQAAYSMLNRWIEEDLTDLLEKEEAGCIAYVPLAQGLLTNKYLDGIPSDSRVAKQYIQSLNEKDISPEVIGKVQKLNKIANERGQSLAQMALVWVLRKKSVVSVLIGASKVGQIEENVEALKNTNFSEEELQQIEKILK
ncbi:L-glyceraldehyde 3-phosphate reductase [Virgibacillus profundi]|uniref:L-glyceraldehyde 3-phosphate reductase n=1 Tax=Virgibacillus profundi TaxID=2024555 RepID=A0A2A2IGR3_9BACI|nr:L-glyceraldehyde 3-phosphate reductase [Virgibacillus profundi]PAV30837.1 L-glyceraldehyde 3-phosphate reductase [Virgibacillus profundi]PXY55020.1 L-glyceraldehyde 3-phosphate reductase [Virgibacillus profundi]